MLARTAVQSAVVGSRYAEAAALSQRQATVRATKHLAKAMSSDTAFASEAGSSSSATISHSSTKPAAPHAAVHSTTISASDVSTPQGPFSGVFAIVKPAGRTSMTLLDALKPLMASSSLFQMTAEDSAQDASAYNGKMRWGKRKRRGKNMGPSAPKIGQGGTLDPLADGVLVIGIGRGTKQLQSYLDCTKEYRTVALLGASTLSYDSDDPILQRRRHTHVDADAIRTTLDHFRGKGTQLPPLYSAVKIDGKRLFDYAREGRDLPRPVERREINVSQLELVQWQAAGTHEYKPAQRECNEEERTVALRARKLAGLDTGDGEENGAATTITTATKETAVDAAPASALSDERDVDPAAFTLGMTVSSGTYVRSIVHDVAARAGSAAYVVKLTRTRQGKWVMPDYVAPLQEGKEGSSDGAPSQAPLKEAIAWDVFERALAQLRASSGEDSAAHKRQAVDGRGDDTDKPLGRGANGHSEVVDETKSATDTSSPAEWERLILERMDRC